MNRLAGIADRIARSLTAGVSIGVADYLPKDMFWVEHLLHQALTGLGRNQVQIDIDGDTRPGGYVGTINIYVKDPEVLENVKSKAWDVVTHLGASGIKGKVRQDVSRMYKVPTVRVDVVSNEDEKFASLESTHITYSTWRSILDWLGFTGVREQAGEMSIQDYLNAYRTPGDFTGKQKEAVFARQIAEMAKEALKHGYKKLSWG